MLSFFYNYINILLWNVFIFIVLNSIKNTLFQYLNTLRIICCFKFIKWE